MNDETLKEQIEQAIINYRIKCDMAVSERDDGFYTQKEYEEAITFELDKVMQLILQDRERAVREAIKRERDRHFAEYTKVQEFYAGGKRRLKELTFPSHCSSCHSEWEDGYGDQEEPCCSRAKSNIIDSIMKWHISESADEVKKVKAELSNPTQEKEK